MKKIITGIVLVAFVLAALPLYAMDYNPYEPIRVSDKPNGDGDPWEDYKKASPRVDNSQTTDNENESNIENNSSIIDFILKLFQNGLEKKQSCQDNIEIQSRYYSSLHAPSVPMRRSVSLFE